MLSSDQSWQLDNRELALLLWLLIGVAFCLANAGVRRSVIQMLLAASAPKVLFPSIGFILMAMLGVELISHLGFSYDELAKDGIIWGLISVFPFMLSTSEASQSALGYKQMILRGLSATILLEGLYNLRPFAFVVELLIIPVGFFLAALVAVGNQDKNTQKIATFIDGCLTNLGCVLVLSATVILLKSARDVVSNGAVIELALPLLLFLFCLPYLYLFCVFLRYDTLRAILPFSMPNNDKRAASRLLLYVFRKCWFDLRKWRHIGENLPLALRLREDPSEDPKMVVDSLVTGDWQEPNWDDLEDG